MSAYALQVRKQLLDLGGRENKKRSITVENALAHLRGVNPRRWRSKQAPGRIERFLILKTEPKPEEIADVQTAHARATPKLIEAKCAENRELAASLRTFIATALVADPEFYSDQIEAARAIARELGQLVGGHGDEDRGGDL